MDTITISVDEYNKLKKESELYRKMVTDNSAAKLTPEQRRERAKKAVEARIKSTDKGPGKLTNRTLSGHNLDTIRTILTTVNSDCMLV